jgi:hypothetical protein
MYNKYTKGFQAYPHWPKEIGELHPETKITREKLPLLFLFST